MPGHHDATLVVASIVIAVFSAYALLALAARVTVARGRVRLAWLLGGGVAVGLGIWSMHFVGMLAVDVGVPMAYAVPTVILSSLVPIAASTLALYVVSRERAGNRTVALAALPMGLAIAGMHVIGMAALRIPARITYSMPLVGAAVAIAIGASAAALWLSIHFRYDDTVRGRRYQLAAALVLGFAIAGMHYTAMAGAHFTRLSGQMTMAPEAVLRTDGLAWAVAVATLLVLSMAVLGSMVDRRSRARSAETEALRRSEDRFRSLVLATAQIVWSANAQGQIDTRQPEWETFTGSDFDHYSGWQWLTCLHPDDRDRTAALWRAALESRTVCEVEYRLCRHDGEYRTMLARSVPVLEPGGRVREWVGAATDVSERKKDEWATAFLAEAGDALSSSLEYETTLRAVARLAVPELADWCAVDLLVEGGGLQRVAVEHPDPAMLELVRDLEERYPSIPDPAHGLHHVIQTGQPDMMAEIPASLLDAAARSDEHRELIRRLGLRSYIVVPLVAREKTLGAITLVHAHSGRRYDERDLRLAQEVARRAAVAIDNARLYHETEESRAQLEQQAAELQEAQAEMEMAHDELQRANDELVQRTSEAEKARAAADEANAAKSAFLATMSHELRTPLNAIAGYAQLLEMGIHGEVTETQREYLEKIRRNQTHLLGLINDVLNFAKIEAGQVQYDIGDVPLDETLAAVEALIEPQVKARRHQYTYRRGDARVCVRADRDRVEQVVLNLLSNAVKFTSPGGRIVMDWEAGERQVRIRVRDTGRGIPDEKLPAIFEPFVQVDPALTRSSEGTGLGLAISRDLARAMHGDLTVESREGVGSTFILTLPRAHDLPASAVPAEQRVA
ncbi:MAG TPA: MHYT domain-containing protein [Longimicrobium sp.]|nr:MHYT domain-containing protein [Longimicrobium sp.]